MSDYSRFSIWLVGEQILDNGFLIFENGSVAKIIGVQYYPKYALYLN